MVKTLFEVRAEVPLVSILTLCWLHSASILHRFESIIYLFNDFLFFLCFLLFTAFPPKAKHTSKKAWKKLKDGKPGVGASFADGVAVAVSVTIGAVVSFVAFSLLLELLQWCWCRY